MLVLACALLFGGTTCVRSAAFIYKDEAARRARLPAAPHDRRGGAFVLPGLLGAGLLAAGAMTAALAVIPLRWLQRIPPNPASTLHENPGADNPRGPWR